MLLAECVETVGGKGERGRERRRERERTKEEEEEGTCTSVRDAIKGIGKARSFFLVSRPMVEGRGKEVLHGL